MVGSFALDYTPRQADSLETHFFEDHFVIYDPDADRVHYLNATAALVFELCDGNRPVSAIADLVCKAYNLAGIPTGEVTACLADLHAAGVIHRSAGE
jgi:hypothetical protein